MDVRIIGGRQATDRIGAAEILGLTEQTIALHASPKRRPSTGFPEPVGREDRRDWYALDDLHAYAATRPTPQQAAPRRAPEWLRDGDPDELLPSTTFRTAANVTQGAWKRYVQNSVPAWKTQHDGYLPLPDAEEDYRGTGTRYFWRRHRMIHWLDHRPGQRARAGRAGGSNPGINDAIAAIQAADGHMTGTVLARTLNVGLPVALWLLKEARRRLSLSDDQ